MWYKNSFVQGFKLGTSFSFPTMVTITQWAPPVTIICTMTLIWNALLLRVQSMDKTYLNIFHIRLDCLQKRKRKPLKSERAINAIPSPLGIKYRFWRQITCTGANTQGQIGAGSDGNKRVLHILQSSSITRASPSDYLVSGHSLGGDFSLCREEVGIFYSPSVVIYLYFIWRSTQILFWMGQ